jgi:hypothetical protein
MHLSRVIRGAERFPYYFLNRKDPSIKRDLSTVYPKVALIRDKII